MNHTRIPYSGVVYNAIAPGPGGRLYGLAAEGISSIAPHSYAVRLEAPFRERITARAACDGRAVYFAAGPRPLHRELGGAKDH